MVAHNPCTHIKFYKLNIDGQEEPFDIDFFGGNETWRLCYRGDNIPIHVDVDIQRSLGSVGDTASISIYNSPFYEEIMLNYNAALAKLRGYMWRVYIWCWYGDENGGYLSDKPAGINPAFVGDVDLNTGFMAASSGGVNDSVINISANGCGHINQNGAYKKRYPVGTSYREIVEDIFQTWIIDLSGYGKHEGGAQKFVIVDKEGRLNQLVKTKTLTISDNPMNFLNDIGKTFDMVWGINNLVPYIMTRTTRLHKPDEIPEIEDAKTNTWFIGPSRGMIGLPSLTPTTINFSCMYLNQLSLGGYCSVDFGGAGAQVNTGETAYSRVNSLNIVCKNGRELYINAGAQLFDPNELSIIRSGRYQRHTGRRFI